ncbi:MAG: hypothetical protein ABIN94_08600 [Ferruginibacter sp.]
MWKVIYDCGKQLTVNAIVRETEEQVKVYNIIEIEFDQYKLQLTSRNGEPITEVLHQTLNCEQLLQFKFEVQDKEHEQNETSA